MVVQKICNKLNAKYLFISPKRFAGDTNLTTISKLTPRNFIWLVVWNMNFV